MSLLCAKPLCVQKIRNDRVQGSQHLETNRELHPHSQLHSSAKQTKGCVLETQPVGVFSSAAGPSAAISLLSDMLNRISCAYVLGNPKAPLSPFNTREKRKKKSTHFHFPKMLLSRSIRQKTTTVRQWSLSQSGLNDQLKRCSSCTQTLK